MPSSLRRFSSPVLPRERARACVCVRAKSVPENGLGGLFLFYWINESIAIPSIASTKRGWSSKGVRVRGWGRVWFRVRVGARVRFRVRDKAKARDRVRRAWAIWHCVGISTQLRDREEQFLVKIVAFYPPRAADSRRRAHSTQHLAPTRT